MTLASTCGWRHATRSVPTLFLSIRSSGEYFIEPLSPEYRRHSPLAVSLLAARIESTPSAMPAATIGHASHNSRRRFISLSPRKESVPHRRPADGPALLQ